MWTYDFSTIAPVPTAVFALILLTSLTFNLLLLAVILSTLSRHRSISEYSSVAALFFGIPFNGFMGTLPNFVYVMGCLVKGGALGGRDLCVR